jgi:glycosyltransferase involved in cell wall biosynthesis
MKILSVIIPIYNVEPFVERCIRSLLNQDLSHDDYEIICVNDGSPDNSREIVLRLQKENNNIILIDQKNQGVSVARNKGLEVATGKYILFVDPDDYIIEDSLNNVIKEIVEINAQVTIPGYLFINHDGSESGRKIFDSGKNIVMSGIDAYNFSRNKGYIVTDTSVGIIFEKEFLRNNGLSYKPGIILNQDVELLARIHCIAERCTFINQFLYAAILRQGSASRSNQFQKEHVRNGFIIAAVNIKNFQDIDRLNTIQKVFLNGPIAKFVLLAIYSAVKSNSFLSLKETIVKLRLAGLSRLSLEGCSPYNRICGRLYNISPFLASIVIPIYLRIIHITQKK